MARESIFTLEATPIKFGPGAVDDAGWELQRLGVTRALLVTDPGDPARRPRLRVAGRARGSRSSSTTARGSSRRSTRCQDAADFALDGGRRRLRLGRRRLLDRHREGREPDRRRIPAPVMDYVNAPVGGGAARAAGRCGRTWRSRRRAAPAARRRPSRCSTSPSGGSRPGSRTATCGPSQAIVDPSLATSLPPRSWPRRGWT